jgi:hypothetical protein
MSFENALDAEINDLQASLDADPRYIKLQELKRVRALYRPLPSNLSFTHRNVNGGTVTVTRDVVRSDDNLLSALHKADNNLLSNIVREQNGHYAPPTTDARSGRKPSPERIQALLIAKETIRGKSEPTKTADIFAKIKEAGVWIGGTDPQNNLSAMLHNSDDFKSHGRAGWTLA